ncbi:hypothetical protein JD969_14790 [Planctomycetota bacterium]|nr:hypothetical protein JD969_14790 [Planctomycetota bacterium]
MSDRLNQLKTMYEADPTDPFVPYGIALEYAKAEAFETALEWLDKTLKLDKHYCYAYFQKGKMFSELGEEEDAKKVLELGVKMAVEAGDQHAASEINDLLEMMD